MWYQKNEIGEIVSISTYQNDSTYSYTNKEICYSFDGRLIFAEETETEEYKAAEAVYLAEKHKNDLRRRRERECFSVVNRGEPWYRQLSDGQKADLDVWYAAWLNVTETLQVPSAPSWLKG